MRDMTAIAITYTPDGFVIGADGLRMGSDKQTIISDSVQKLFYFQKSDAQLIYGWCGTVQLFDRNGACIFDCVSRSTQLLEASRFFSHIDFVAFIHLIRSCLDGLLRESRLVKRGDSLPINLNGELARMFIAGYFQNQACFAELAINIEDEMLKPVSIPRIKYPLFLARDVFSGSAKALATLDSRKIFNRDDSLRFVQDYIQACIENPDPGQKFGGHIHIAELNPSGFTWVSPPTNSN
jgi:hypothetical protein